jgi:uncharacterized protein (TIGR02246 family)
METARWARRWAQTWRTAWPAQDVEAIAALQAEDGDHWAGITRRYRGRAGLRTYLTECFAEETRPAEVRFGEPVVSGDSATVEYWAVTYPGGAPLTIAGCTVLLFDAGGLVAEARDYSHAEPGVVRPHPRLFLPGHLRADVESLHRAWPAGLPETDYRPLLAALEDHYSEENLAAVVGAFLGRDPIRVANDAAGLAADPPAPGDVQRVRDGLLLGGS